MKLSKIISEMSFGYDPEFEAEVKKLTDQGAKFLGQGDNGKAYELNGKVYKITTDEVELEHAQLLKGKTTENLAHIYSVEQINTRLGTIEMENLEEYQGEVPQEFIDAVELEVVTHQIDVDELDIRPSNVMQDTKGKLKLVDI